MEEILRERVGHLGILLVPADRFTEGKGQNIFGLREEDSACFITFPTLTTQARFLECSK